MTIEELVRIECEDKCLIEPHYQKEIIALCKKVRELTIEECKNKVDTYTHWENSDTPIVEIDYDSFPTDLNNIDI